MHRRSRHKKKLGSYPYIGVTVSITLALFVTGLFGTLLIYSAEFEQLVRRNIQLQVYLRNGLTEVQRVEVERKLESLPYIQGPSALDFISKDEAAKKFIAETGEDFKQLLGENPLHDAYLVRIDPAYHSREKMDAIQKEIEGLSGIYQVVYLQGMIESINRNFISIGLVLMGLAMLFLITVALLINNTIKLALFSQRFLIRSMQLVGATRSFIQRPFLLRAAGYGLLGGLLASAAIHFVTNYADEKIADLSDLRNEQYILSLFGLLLIIGIIVSVSSTYFSIRRYLRMSLDELY